MNTLTLEPVGSISGEVVLPGSKSLTNRALLLAALARGKTRIANVLLSDDTRHMLEALDSLGSDITLNKDSREVWVTGHGGPFPASNKQREFFLGNAGTAIRPLTAALALTPGAYVIDAPVSGGVQGADKGTLAVMVGGNPQVVERVRPLLEVIGASVVYVGGVGSGTVAKLVHNAISMTTRIVIQEGMTLAVKAGVDPNVMLNVLREASFGKQLVLTDHIPDLVLKGDFDHPRFSLGLSHKDVSLALELAREMEAPMGMAERADEEIQRGIDRGWADRDNLVTFLLAEERAGVEVRE